MPLYELTAEQVDRLHGLVGAHEVSPDAADSMAEIRRAAGHLLETIARNCPPGGDRLDAIARVREATMWANSAVAHNPAEVAQAVDERPRDVMRWDGSAAAATPIIDRVLGTGGGASYHGPTIVIRPTHDTADDIVVHAGDRVARRDGGWVNLDRTSLYPRAEHLQYVVWDPDDTRAIREWLVAVGEGHTASRLPERPGRLPELSIQAPPPHGHPGPYVVATMVPGQAIRYVDGRLALSELDDEGDPVTVDGVPVFAGHGG